MKLYTSDKVDGGEVVRLILIQTGEEFEDIRISSEDLPKKKDKLPYGILPALEIDGSIFGGTLAIGQYLGDKYGMSFNSEDLLSRAQLNSMCEAVYQTIVVLSRYWSENDSSLREQKKADILEEVPERLSGINQRIKDNGTTASGFCCDQLTYADFFVFFLFTIVLPRVYTSPDEQMAERAKYPEVQRVCEALRKLPRLVKYYESPSNTEYAMDA